MLRVFTVTACLGLAGCVAPPIVTYVSLALDGMSFATTGKSVGDHALSAVVGKDCALLRVISEGDIKAVCLKYATDEEREIAVAPSAASTFRDANVEIAPEKIPPNPDEYTVPILLVAARGDVVESLGGNKFTENRQAIYLMIGNFPSIEGAEKLAARVTGMPAVVAPATAGDARYFRVVAGPIAPDKTKFAQSRLQSIGIGNSWLANLCTGSLGAPPCEN